MSHSGVAHTPAREGRGEADTIAIFDLPPKRILPERRPRRRLFPNGWQDIAAASIASFFLLLDAATLHFLFHMGGHL